MRKPYQLPGWTTNSSYYIVPRSGIELTTSRLHSFTMAKVSRAINHSAIYISGNRQDAIGNSDITKISTRINYKICLLTFKALHGQRPQYISDMLSLSVMDTTSYDLTEI